MYVLRVMLIDFGYHQEFWRSKVTVAIVKNVSPLPREGEIGPKSRHDVPDLKVVLVLKRGKHWTSFEEVEEVVHVRHP